MAGVSNTLWREQFRSMLMDRVSRACGLRSIRNKGLIEIVARPRAISPRQLFIHGENGEAVYRYYLSVTSFLTDDDVPDDGEERFKQLVVVFLQELRMYDPGCVKELEDFHNLLYWPAECTRRDAIRTRNRARVKAIEAVEDSFSNISEVVRLAESEYDLITEGTKIIFGLLASNAILKAAMVAEGLIDIVHSHFPAPDHTGGKSDKTFWTRSRVHLAKVSFAVYRDGMLLTSGQDHKSKPLESGFFYDGDLKEMMVEASLRCGYPKAGHGIGSAYRRALFTMESGRNPFSPFWMFILAESMRTWAHTYEMNRYRNQVQKYHESTIESLRRSEPKPVIGTDHSNLEEHHNDWTRKKIEDAEIVYEAIFSDPSALALRALSFPGDGSSGDIMQRAALEVATCSLLAAMKNEQKALDWLENARGRLQDGNIVSHAAWCDWYVVCAQYFSLLGLSPGKSEALRRAAELSMACYNERDHSKYRQASFNAAFEASNVMPISDRPRVEKLFEFVRRTPVSLAKKSQKSSGSGSMPQ